MRLDWNDIQARAARFVESHKHDHYEKGHTQSFYNDFFDVFGVPLRRVASFEKSVKPKPGERGFIDLFWPGKLLVEQKSAGRDLKKRKNRPSNISLVCAMINCRAMFCSRIFRISNSMISTQIPTHRLHFL